MSKEVRIKVKKLDEKAIIPMSAHLGDAGVDLYSTEDKLVNPGDVELVHTGIALEIPYGYEGQVRPRSGNALTKHYTVLNTPGTIDCGYRGEIGVIIYNANCNKIVDIHKGDRIAQLVINEIPTSLIFEEVDELDNTDRGTVGFGSSGD